MTNPTKINKDWRFYLGILVFALAWVLPVFCPLVLFLGLSSSQTTFITGALIVGGPEVLMILAVALLGKETLNYYTSKIKKLLNIPDESESFSKFRYYLGLTIMLLSIVPLYLYGYLTQHMPADTETKIHILAAGDIAFILSFFIAGEQLWDKTKRLFVYEKEKI